MKYLIDSSALHRLVGDSKLFGIWRDTIELRQIASCWLQRTELLYSARSTADYERLREWMIDLFPPVSMPKRAEQWVESVQYRMVQHGQHRSAGAVDLVIAATAAHHGLTVLHDDRDFVTVCRFAAELSEQNVTDPVSM